MKINLFAGITGKKLKSEGNFMEMGMASKIYNNCEKYGGGGLRLEKPAPVKYDVLPLIQAAQAYIDANSEYFKFASTVRGKLLKGAKEKKYWRLYEVSGTAEDFLLMFCKGVGADYHAVKAVVKSFRRYSQYHTQWNFCPESHLTRKNAAAFRRVVQA